MKTIFLNSGSLGEPNKFFSKKSSLPLKSKVVIFTRCPRHKNELPIRITIFGQVIPLVTEAEFLGVIFDSRLTWESQTRHIVSKAYNRLNLLRAISSLTKKPSPNLLKRLYESMIRSIFECSSLYIVSAAQCHLDKLQLVKNQAICVILNVPAYIAIDNILDAAGLLPIKDHLVNF